MDVLAVQITQFDTRSFGVRRFIAAFLRYAAIRKQQWRSVSSAEKRR
jgi:hypothetical protein